MEEEKLRELEAAQAETVRKLASAQRAADRAAELQFLSPSLRTYVSENPNAVGLPLSSGHCPLATVDALAVTVTVSQ